MSLDHMLTDWMSAVKGTWHFDRAMCHKSLLPNSVVKIGLNLPFNSVLHLDEYVPLVVVYLVIHWEMRKWSKTKLLHPKRDLDFDSHLTRCSTVDVVVSLIYIWRCDALGFPWSIRKCLNIFCNKTLSYLR